VIVLKPPFAVGCAGFVVERLWARAWRDAIAMATVDGRLHARPRRVELLARRRTMVMSNEAWRWAHGVDALHDTLLALDHGVLPYAPWVAVGLFGLVRALGPRRGEARAVLRCMAIPTLFYVAFLASTDIKPGYCYGPRYWVPLLPFLAVAAVDVVRTRIVRRAGVFALLVLVSAAVAIPGSLRYGELWDKPVLAVWRR